MKKTNTQRADNMDRLLRKLKNASESTSGLHPFSTLSRESKSPSLTPSRTPRPLNPKSNQSTEKRKEEPVEAKSSVHELKHQPPAEVPKKLPNPLVNLNSIPQECSYNHLKQFDNFESFRQSQQRPLRKVTEPEDTRIRVNTQSSKQNQTPQKQIHTLPDKQVAKAPSAITQVVSKSPPQKINPVFGTQKKQQKQEETPTNLSKTPVKEKPQILEKAVKPNSRYSSVTTKQPTVRVITPGNTNESQEFKPPAKQQKPLEIHAAEVQHVLPEHIVHAPKPIPNDPKAMKVRENVSPTSKPKVLDVRPYPVEKGPQKAKNSVDSRIENVSPAVKNQNRSKEVAKQVISAEQPLRPQRTKPEVKREDTLQMSPISDRNQSPLMSTTSLFETLNKNEQQPAAVQTPEPPQKKRRPRGERRKSNEAL